MQQNECFKYWQTIVLFVLTAGVTLSNGVKTYIYELFVGGRKFFKLKHLIFVVVVPPLMIMVVLPTRISNIHYWPHEHEQALRKMKQAKSDQQKILTRMLIQRVLGILPLLLLPLKDISGKRLERYIIEI